MTRVSIVPAVKDALVALVAATVGDQVQTVYGAPGLYQADDIVAVAPEVRATTEPGPISPLRRREEIVQLTLVVSVYRGGDVEVQRLVTQRAYELLSLVFDAIQADPTLNGTCRTAAMVSHEMAEAVAWDESNPELPPVAVGRVTEIAAVVEAASRI